MLKFNSQEGVTSALQVLKETTLNAGWHPLGAIGNCLFKKEKKKLPKRTTSGKQKINSLQRRTGNRNRNYGGYIFDVHTINKGNYLSCL